MLLMFSLINEAGARVPGAMGGSFSIVSGLILGQAAVSAKIVSPIMIIIIAITGIGSFATANYSLGWAYRILRLIFIALGGSLGLFGIGLGIFAYSVYIGTLSNFGIRFLSPMPGNVANKIKKSVFTEPIWDKEKRPEYLETKNDVSEAKISRRWIYKKDK